MMYSKKQQELLTLWRSDKLGRICILEGAVRSGKTWISLVLWFLWIMTMPKNQSYLMVGKTLSTLKRNILDLLVTLVGEDNFTYSISSKEGKLFGRTIYLEGVSDTRAESKIRGLTLAGAYCDELSLFDEAFFSMLLSRLSVPKAKLIGTTNPDSPNHWLMQNYILRKDLLDITILKFLLDDNTFLDPLYLENLKKEYTGVFYKRYILGEWVVADGLVYPMFDTNKHIVKDPPAKTGLYYLSIDYGTVNPFSAGLWKIVDGVAYRIREYYYKGNHNARKTDEEYYHAIDCLVGEIKLEYIVIDPSAASFIECIRRDGKYKVCRAVNSVLYGIQLVSSLLKSERLKFCSLCKDSIREFLLYRFDEKSSADSVVKEDDHAMDEIRYFCATVLQREFRWVDWKDSSK